MRDLLIVGIVGLGALAALRRPWIGFMLWTWLSIMNPHRFTYGFANTAPLAAVAAAALLAGLVMTKDKTSPFKGAPVSWMVAFMVWITLSWLLGLDVEGDYEQWKKVMKIDFMIIIGMALLYSKQHVIALAWVAAGSLALLGLKGGIFTVASGGNYRVWGPEGSFIYDNNEFALSLVMTIPLLRFLQLQLMPGWVKPRHSAWIGAEVKSSAVTRSQVERPALRPPPRSIRLSTSGRWVASLTVAAASSAPADRLNISRTDCSWAKRMMS